MATVELIIKPRKGWQPFDFRELVMYRELLGFLAWRDIKIRYRQTVLGGLWAVLQPLVGMFTFTLVFHRLAGVHSDGPPYALFAFVGLVPWTFFANSVTTSSNSLISNQHLVSKVYFPRIIVPLGAIGALVLDFCLSLALLAGLMAYYHWPVTSKVFLLPLFVFGTFLAASGIGFTLSALNVVFRDVKHLVPFLVQTGMYLTPVIYPVRYVPQRWQSFLGINPMAGMVLGFRHCLLGSRVSWIVVMTSMLVSLSLFLSGLMIFRRMERRFADII